MEFMESRRKPLSISNVTYKNTSRTTVCDIMCTVNTFAAFEPQKREKLKALVATLPYERSKSMTGPIKSGTLYQKMKVNDITIKKIEELKRDRDLFFYQITKEKKDKDQRKYIAAVKIQSLFRGFRKRRNPNPRYIRRKKEILVLSQHAIDQELVSMALNLNLPPIPGLTLESKSRSSKRRRKVEQVAATRIQKFFKMIYNKKLAKIRVENRKYELLNIMAKRITSFIRHTRTKNFAKKVTKVKRNRMALIIQKSERIRQAYKKVRLLKAKKRLLAKHTEAVIIIQRNFAPKYYVMTFARAAKIESRKFGEYSIEIVEKLIEITPSILLNDTLSIISQELFEEEWSTMLKSLQTSENNIIDDCVNQCIESSLSEWIVEYIALEIEKEKLRELNEQRLLLEESLKNITEELAETEDTFETQKDPVTPSGSKTTPKTQKTPRTGRKGTKPDGVDETEDDTSTSRSRKGSFTSVISFEEASVDFDLTNSVANFVDKIASRTIDKVLPDESDDVSTTEKYSDIGTARSLVSFYGDEASTNFNLSGSVAEFVNKITDKEIKKAIPPEPSDASRDSAVSNFIESIKEQEMSIDTSKSPRGSEYALSLSARSKDSRTDSASYTSMDTKPKYVEFSYYENTEAQMPSTVVESEQHTSLENTESKMSSTYFTSEQTSYFENSESQSQMPSTYVTSEQSITNRTDFSSETYSDSSSFISKSTYAPEKTDTVISENYESQSMSQSMSIDQSSLVQTEYTPPVINEHTKTLLNLPIRDHSGKEDSMVDFVENLQTEERVSGRSFFTSETSYSDETSILSKPRITNSVSKENIESNIPPSISSPYDSLISGRSDGSFVSEDNSIMTKPEVSGLIKQEYDEGSNYEAIPISLENINNISNREPLLTDRSYTISEASYGVGDEQLRSALKPELSTQLSVENSEADFNDAISLVAVPQGEVIYYTRGIISLSLSEDEKNNIEVFMISAVRSINDGKYEKSFSFIQKCDVILDRLPKEEMLNKEYLLLNSSIKVIKANVFFAVANYEDSKVLYEAALADRKMLLGDSHIITVESLMYIGEWYRAVAMYNESESFFLKAISFGESIIAEKKYEPNYSEEFVHLIVAKLYIKFSELMKNCGQYYKANESVKKTQIFIRSNKSKGFVSSEIEGEFIICLVSLLNIKGKYSNCVSLHQELLEKRQKYYANLPNHPKIASSMTAVGALLLLKCDYGPACKLIEDGLAMRRELYPVDHPSIAASLYLKATAFASFGNYQDAAIEMANSLEIRLKKFGNNHPSVAQSLTGMANIQTMLGYPEDALPNYFKALNIRKERFGIDLHRDIGESIFYLGVNAEVRGSYLEAVNYLQNSLQLREALLSLYGSDVQFHLDVELNKVYLARVYGLVSRIEEAKNMIRNAVKMITQIVGQNNALVARSLCFLGELCRTRGNYSDAKTLFSLSFNVVNQLYGDNHPDVANVMAESSENFRIPGFYEESIELCNSSYEIRLFMFGNNNLSVAKSLHLRAQILRDSGNLKEAEQIYIQALNMVVGKIGENNGIYGSILSSLCECYRLRNRKNLSEKTFHRAIEILKGTYGDKSLIVTETLCNYCNLLINMKNPTGAYEILNMTVLPVFESTIGKTHPWTMYTKACMALASHCLSLVSKRPNEKIVLDKVELMTYPDIEEFLVFCKNSSFSETNPWILRFKGDIIDEYSTVDFDSRLDESKDRNEDGSYSQSTSIYDDDSASIESSLSPRSLVSQVYKENSSLQTSLQTNSNIISSTETSKPYSDDDSTFISGSVTITPRSRSQYSFDTNQKSQLFSPTSQTISYEDSNSQSGTNLQESSYTGSQTDYSSYQSDSVSMSYSGIPTSRSQSKSLVEYSPRDSANKRNMSKYKHQVDRETSHNSQPLVNVQESLKNPEYIAEITEKPVKEIDDYSSVDSYT